MAGSQRQSPLPSAQRCKNQSSPLRDRLVTADLRLSVQLDTPATHGSDGMQTDFGTVCVVHGATRAQLDPAHAQRIIGITSEADQGLIALVRAKLMQGQSANDAARFLP